MDLPYLDIKNANAFEPVDSFLNKYRYLSHAIAVTLLKIRLHADLKALQVSAAVGQKAPQEIVDHIRDQLISPTVPGNAGLLKTVKDGKSLAPHIKAIDTQVSLLYNTVKEANKHFWPALVDLGNNLTARSEYYSLSTHAEMQLALKYNCSAWMETPGAIDVIRARLKG